MSDLNDLWIGEEAINKGFISTEQFYTVCKLQQQLAEKDEKFSIAEVMLQEGLLEQDQVDQIILWAKSQHDRQQNLGDFTVDGVQSSIHATNISDLGDFTVDAVQTSIPTTHISNLEDFTVDAVQTSIPTTNVSNLEDSVNSVQAVTAPENSTNQPQQSNAMKKVEQQFGRYKIIEEIGRGSIGRVYKTLDTQLQRAVALKVLLQAGSPKRNARFLREAKATAKLHHPNIITLHDIGEEKGVLFFTMDFIEGQSLKEFAKSTSMSMRQIATIMAKIADAIHYAHRRGVIHRDIKPANIMIQKDYEPKVMDFGLAKLADSSQKLSQSGMVMGTLNYMPPEQAEGKLSRIDARSDVYALGAVLHELLTGRPPVSGNTVAQILQQIISPDSIPSIRNKHRRIPENLEAICLKALKKKKRERYSSAHLMAKDLHGFIDNFLQGAPTSEPPSKKKSSRRVAKNNMGMMVFAATIFLSILLLAKYLYQPTPITTSKEKEATQRAQEAERDARQAEKKANDVVQGIKNIQQNLEKKLQQSKQAQQKSQQTITELRNAYQILKKERDQSIKSARLALYTISRLYFASRSPGKANKPWQDKEGIKKLFKELQRLNIKKELIDDNQDQQNEMQREVLWLFHIVNVQNYMDLKKYKIAQKFAHKLIKLNPKDFNGYRYLAVALIADKSFANAKDVMTEGMEKIAEEQKVYALNGYHYYSAFLFFVEGEQQQALERLILVLQMPERETELIQMENNKYFAHLKQYREFKEMVQDYKDSLDDG